jgi:hypothetical protein
MPRTALPILLLGAILLFGGCDKHAGDKQAIRDVFYQYFTVGEIKSGAQAAGIVTGNTIEYYRRLVKWGLNGKKEDLAKLTPFDRLEIVRMRNRATRAQLKDLDGAGYIFFATAQGWYAVGGDVDFFELGLIRIKPDGAEATAQMLFRGEMIGHFAVFRKENDDWKLDETSLFPFYNKVVSILASEDGMPVDEAIMRWEEEDSHKPVPPTIWDPMK